MINILNFLHFSSLLTKTSQAMDNPTFDNLWLSLTNHKRITAGWLQLLPGLDRGLVHVGRGAVLAAVVDHTCLVHLDLSFRRHAPVPRHVLRVGRVAHAAAARHVATGRGHRVVVQGEIVLAAVEGPRHGHDHVSVHVRLRGARGLAAGVDTWRILVTWLGLGDYLLCNLDPTAT